MQVIAFYVGSSLLSPLRAAEREVNAGYGLGLRLEAYNFGGQFNEAEWRGIEEQLSETEIVFVIHVMDGENASRLMPLLDQYRARHRAVIVINCMPELMRHTRMGKLDFARLPGMSRKGAKSKDTTAGEDGPDPTTLLSSIGSWIGKQVRRGRPGRGANGNSHAQYLKFIERLPAALRFVPGAGALRDVKNYLMLFTYFLQPTPVNIRSMVLYALKNYSDDERLAQIDIPPPESMPSVGIYHPDALKVFDSFEEYEAWYAKASKHKAQNTKLSRDPLNPQQTLGLLLMRPQIVSQARKHYDELIRAIEAEGLSVIPAISTFMDNREACRRFFIKNATDNDQLTTDTRSRVSQIVSLTGFSFVGGPAMNDSEAASEFLNGLNVPYRSLVSLDAQTVESWTESFTGLNPVQTGMQVAIPEIDGGTEPSVFGGIPARGVEPAPLIDRCQRIARRLKRWNRLQVSPRDQLKIALVLYCFPPNKGNLGTAADLDVFVSVFDILGRLKQDGYHVELPVDVQELRNSLLGGNSAGFGTTANVVHRIKLDEYRNLCPFVSDIESEWGEAPGAIGVFENELLVQGIMLGNVFVGLQPSFGYEADPMRLLMAKGAAPHHGFAAFYAFLEKVFKADAVVHVGTHGAMEFMPGKQVGLSSACWPDRLIGEMPNIYIYSVNNPSEGTIAKRRSYAELISYLTPPIENAGLYKGLASLKETINAYRTSDNEEERARLFQVIEASRRELNLEG